MFAATRRWFRRNRTPIAVGVGLVGAGYVVTQYVLTKINDARERMSNERIAKENLRRRFEQNQEDCTFTVLALLPTATNNILEAMNTEKITYEIQQMKGAAKGMASPPSISETTMTDEDGKSLASLQSESGVHASQVAVPPGLATVAEASQDGGVTTAQKSRRTKRQLWDDLIISSTTRAFTLIYTLALLTMLTRIQLNLLGRRSYLSSVVTLATGPAQAGISLENTDDDNPEQAYGSDFETNRRYLTFSWWLLNRGWADLRARVEAAVREVFGHLSPRDSLAFDALAPLVLGVRRIVEGDTPEARRRAHWLPYLLPPRELEDEVLRESGILGASPAAAPVPAPPAQPSPAPATVPAAAPASLRRLLDETADLVESPPFSHVLTLLLDAGFSHLVDAKLAAEAFELVPAPGSEGAAPATVPASAAGTTVEEATRQRREKAVMLPRVLSVLTRQAHAIGGGVPNEYLREMEGRRELEAFAAVVYSSNWESEVVGDEGLMASAVDLAAEAGAPQAEVVAGEGKEEEDAGRPVGASQGSLFVVDPQTSFESAWQKAVDQR